MLQRTYEYVLKVQNSQLRGAGKGASFQNQSWSLTNVNLDYF